MRIPFARPIGAMARPSLCRAETVRTILAKGRASQAEGKCMPSPLQSWTRWRQAAGFCCAVAVCTPGVAQPPTEPLHAQIDHLIEASLTPPVAPLSGDAEFLRRVSLDLAGTIPTAEEARAFLDDPSPAKRASAVDSLVSSKQFARHMTDTFDLLLMERQPSQKSRRASGASFSTSRSWHISRSTS